MHIFLSIVISTLVVYGPITTLKQIFYEPVDDVFYQEYIVPKQIDSCEIVVVHPHPLCFGLFIDGLGLSCTTHLNDMEMSSHLVTP